ncbi:uncharacterized protein J3D65DRAFT_618321 [Phyllosticta citribraziliensis]|uniref:Uncharacterized protein n=1 Tax=Phyllosticta citribraziliensis TaxID=989973 RepID=A0ABR1LXE9_9PEZI
MSAPKPINPVQPSLPRSESHAMPCTVPYRTGRVRRLGSAPWMAAAPTPSRARLSTAQHSSAPGHWLPCAPSNQPSPGLQRPLRLPGAESKGPSPLQSRASLHGLLHATPSHARALLMTMIYALPSLPSPPYIPKLLQKLLAYAIQFFPLPPLDETPFSPPFSKQENPKRSNQLLIQPPSPRIPFASPPVCLLCPRRQSPGASGL